MDTSTTFSCMKCRLMMEATLDQHLGDLVRSNSDSTAADISVERLSHAENLYKLALDKLNLSVWKNCVSCPEKANAESMMLEKSLVKDAECVGSNNLACSVANDQGRGKSTREAPKAKMEAKKSRKNAPKPLPKDQCLIPENNSRLTRSKYRSTQNLSMSTSGELQVGGLRCLKGNNASDFSDTISQRESLLETNGCIVSSGSEVKCICNKMGCWHCLLMDVMNSGLVDNLLNMKWELVRRRLSLRLLTSIGMDANLLLTTFCSDYSHASPHAQTLPDWLLMYLYSLR